MPDAATMSSDDDQSQSTAATEEAAAIEKEKEHQNEIFHEAKALELKDEGNKALMGGKALDAVRLYSEALEFAPTNAIILSNRAMAYIKLENYGLAIHDATNAIKADAAYAKGYYRRGTAEFALNKYKGGAEGL